MQNNYPPCDYCKAELDYMPWHGSGLINGEESRHIHACNDCRHLLPCAEQPVTVKAITAALKPFADAFEATGIQSYAGADEQFAKFIDCNRVLPADGLTVKQFRLAWEVLNGKSALLGKEGEA